MPTNRTPHVYSFNPITATLASWRATNYITQSWTFSQYVKEHYLRSSKFLYICICPLNMMQT